VFASLADSYDRHPILLALVLIYVLRSLGLALNKDGCKALMALRVVQSIGSSAIPQIAYGTVADVAVVSGKGETLGPMMATCNSVSATGSVIGGAIALDTGGHTWVFVTLLIVEFLSFLAMGFIMSETARRVTTMARGSSTASGGLGQISCREAERHRLPKRHDFPRQRSAKVSEDSSTCYGSSCIPTHLPYPT
jgi:MFS family permease